MRTIGIDFGTEEIRVSQPGFGITYREPAMVAIRLKDGNPVQFGDAAVTLARSNPSEYKICSPFRANWILGEKTAPIASDILAYFLHAAYKENTDGVRLLLSIPCGLSDEEEYATAELGHRAGYDEVHLVYSPIAALVGSGHSLEKTFFAVNVGVTVTDIAIVSDSNLVYHASHRIGGYSFSAAIRDYVLKKCRLKISFSEAEKVKKDIGTVWSDEEQRMVEFVGVDASGAVHRQILSSEEMFSALEEPCAELLDAIHHAATKVPLDAVEELMKRGILLFGGGTRLRGITEMIAGITGFRVTLAEKPQDAVAQGLAKILPTLPKKLPVPNVSMIACKTNSYID